MAPTLQTLLPPTRSGRTLYAASLLLGLGAVVQLVLMGLFVLRGGGVARHPDVPPIRFADTAQPVMPAAETPAPPAIAAPTPAAPAAVADAQAALPLGTLARPTPASDAPAAAGVASLVEQARQLRQRGDMPSALARLREAQVAAPEDPQIIAEMAVTYEKMQLGERAAEQWQRIVGMGESVGALYDLADSRLHAAPAPAPGSTAPAAPAAVVGLANSPSGFDDSTVLKITDIHLDEVPDPDAEKKLVLKIVVKDRPGSAIDPLKVRILTYFYDQIDGNDIVLTNAQTAYAWVTPGPVDWSGDKSEVLETTYRRPKSAPPQPAPADPPPPAAHVSRRGAHGKKPEVAAATPAPSATPASVRTFYGYEVRLYYDRQLQDVQADPVRLLQKYIPPSTLPAE